MCLGYFNRHMCKHVERFDGANEECVVGRRNIEERMLLEFCLEKELCV